MNAGEMKVAQLLREAYALEMGLVTTLQGHVEMAEASTYKDDLQFHVTETVRHARSVRERLDELGYLEDENVLQRIGGLAQKAGAQGLALARAPWEILRGKGDPAETMLRNAQDEATTEAREVAIYLALEHVAQQVGDVATAELAREIRQDEETMLEKLGKSIPQLAEEVVRSQVVGASTGSR